MFTINLTRPQLDNLQSALAASGTQIAISPSGEYTISGSGVTATAVYDETLGSLAVTIVRKPAFVPESMIEHRLLEAVNKTAV